MFKRIYPVALVLIGLIIGGILQPFQYLQTFAQPQQQADCQTFKETGKTVCGRFLEYWQKNGGLAQQGLPLSGEFSEKSDLDGKTYTVQYFERAVFEKHPENKTPYDVLLSQLGTFQFKNKYKGVEPNSTPQATAVVQPTVPPSAQFQVLQLNTHKNSLDDNIYVGLVKYNGSKSKSHLNVVVTFSDSKGQILDTEQPNSYLDIVRSGVTFPIEFSVDGDIPSTAHIDYVFEAEDATQSDENYYSTSFQVEQASLVDKGKVVGKVKNTGSKAVQFVEVVVLFYDASGKLLDIGESYTSLKVLEPGVSSPFDVSTYYADTVTRVEVLVTGSYK